ncbi:unnamed protein product [Dovyalis caffra]|uniref:Sulfotransferase n=1 Tax=Dovyalis caffra TaxID=77055 RepID=A0AAV1R3W2_9ROSI|nr:unnamed protein product [Dovyalis caffra]
MNKNPSLSPHDSSSSTHSSLPRIFNQYPYPSLLDSIKNSSYQIVYLCRNPFDTFISLWHFVSQARLGSLGPLSLEDSFDKFQWNWRILPFFFHVLRFWTKSLERPEKLLFLKFEGMKEDINSQIKRLVELLGCPFSVEKERDVAIEGISKFCSFSNLKNKKANKTGKSIPGIENNTLFRRDEVGNWVNFLTPMMVHRLNKIMEQKLAGSGL